jgi:hypothetical protein
VAWRASLRRFVRLLKDADVESDPAVPARFTSPHGRERFRLTFDEDAAAYDRSRPGPPPPLFVTL